jgi:dimethylamine--corrinoid protein Co-methyltransferase
MRKNHQRELKVPKKYTTRMGDGFAIELTEDEIKRDIEDGTADAAERGKIQPLSDDDQRHLLDIFKCPDKFVGVERGREVVLSYDSGTTKFKRVNVTVSKIQSLQIYERILGADTLELAHIDYSFKPVKPIVMFERPILEQALLLTIPPLFYGAMPNLGLYSRPDGPCDNPADLLPNGKIAEARASYEEQIEYATKDMVYVASQMYEAGADGINFDTTAAAGDPEFMATLKAIEILRKKYPSMCIQMGMASEFVLGMHGELYHDGVRLAGLYPHKQLELAEKVGVTIFGPTVNIVTNKSLPWNIARAVTFTKACSEISSIPIHACMGMGVGGVPLTLSPPVDALSRASKAMVEIARLDGL